jgi:hypothetical protein
VAIHYSLQILTVCAALLCPLSRSGLPGALGARIDALSSLRKMFPLLI